MVTFEDKSETKKLEFEKIHPSMESMFAAEMPVNERVYTDFQSAYWAAQLSLKQSADSALGLSRSLSNSRIDLNPHQVDAALFAMRSPLSKGVVLADEVGLGKTIEAGLVLAQRWAERRRRILIIVPATLRKQWAQELDDKFHIPSVILESADFNRMVKAGNENPFNQEDHVVICSYHFATNKSDPIAIHPWDLVVIDEAHRLRNVYKKGNKMARTLRDALQANTKVLLTATPLQNTVMELYGLVSFIDAHVFGDESSFREQFLRADDEVLRNQDLRRRLAQVCHRTLRRQVREYIKFTQRIPITWEFYPTHDEHQLYQEVSAYLQRKVGSKSKYSPYRNRAVARSFPVICFTRCSERQLPSAPSLVATRPAPFRRATSFDISWPRRRMKVSLAAATP